MARGKKKESALTPEEKLAQALVPDWEQPYKVPENWCWTRLMHVAKWGSGGTPSRRNPAYYEGCIPWIKTGELNDDYIYETEEHISDEAITNSSAKLFPINTVAIAMYGATIGKVGILGVEATTNQACACAVASPALDYRYLFRYAQSQKDAFIKKGKGGAQPNISQEIIKEHEIPLPPLVEQQRIVDRIESLFAKLDEAKEKAQSVLDSFETRKAAILHKAFTGELTAKWRAEHDVEDESWHSLNFGDLIIAAKNGTTVKQNKEKNGYPVTRIETLQGGTLDFSRLGYIIDPETISPEDYYMAGDIAFSHINSAAHVGKTALIEAGFLPLIHGMNLLRIRLNEKCIPEYFVWYSRSADYKEQILQRINMAVNQVSINQKQLKTMPINVPKTQEQREIVRILDNLLAKEQQAKEAAEAVLDKIDLLKKSILARAFRGELGTNDPTEESALELLKEILKGDI